MSFTRGFFTGIVTTLIAVGVYQYSNEQPPQVYQREKSGSLFPQEATEAIKRRILRYGIPQRGEAPLIYSNHILSYDRSKRTPVWVAERITQDQTQGSANRKHSKFIPDPGIPSPFTAENADYVRSGWSKGHMAPAGNNKFDQRAMDETFYLTNIVPQDMDNNAGFWNRLESYCRDLTQRFESVQILSGPLTLPTQTDPRGQKLVVYPVIGPNEVAVPTHLYKIILVESNGTPSAIGCFIVPNEAIKNKNSLKEFQVSLEEVQKRTGVEFFPMLDHLNLKNLCNVDSCSLGKRHTGG